MSTLRRRCQPPADLGDWLAFPHWRMLEPPRSPRPSRRVIFLTGAAEMTAAIPQFLRLSRILLMLLPPALVAPQAAWGQGDCEAMPAGRGRTDCFIGPRAHPQPAIQHRPGQGRA